MHMHAVTASGNAGRTVLVLTYLLTNRRFSAAYVRVDVCGRSQHENVQVVDAAF